ncbi:hypothetical protein ACSJHF_24150, partial [Klebsiella pneumoniae]|uniref:hypothetical protein n=1 Tax=Klebsiella pneumoniae TaxID=573 RepID=UPI003EE1E206
LSRSGGTGISQPSTKKGTPSHLNQNQLLAINVPLIPDQDNASGKSNKQALKAVKIPQCIPACVPSY